MKGIAPDNEGDEYPLLEFLASYQGGRGADSRPGTYDAVGEIQETVPVDSLGPALSSYTPFRFVSGRILGSAMAPFSMLSNIFTDRQSIVETPLPVSMPGTSKTEDFREPGGLEAVPTAEEGGMAIGSVVEMEAKTLTVHRAMRRAAEIDAKTLPSVPDVGTLAIPRFPGFIETSDVTLDIPYGLIPEIPDLPVPTYWTCEVPGVKKDEYLHKLATMMGGEIIRDTVLGAVISKEDIGASPIHSFPGPAGKTESGAARHVPDVGRAGIVRVTPISPGTPARTSPLPKVPEPAATEKRSSDDPLSKSLERLRDMKRKDLLESDANETKKEKNDEMYGMVKSENEILGDMNRRDEFRMVEKMLEKEAKRYGLVFR